MRRPATQLAAAVCGLAAFVAAMLLWGDFTTLAMASGSVAAIAGVFAIWFRLTEPEREVVVRAEVTDATGPWIH